MGVAPNADSTPRAWHVYVVRCADGTLYTGISTDVSARVVAHNRGCGAKYTRGRLPVELVYQEPAPDRGAAQRREREIKRLAPKAKRTLLRSTQAARHGTPVVRRKMSGVET